MEKRGGLQIEKKVDLGQNGGKFTGVFIEIGVRYVGKVSKTNKSKACM